MSTNSNTKSMVIVAIPDENDRVWKVSSQKVPHLTLLFLGDADKVANAASIVTFVQHAVDRSLNRFYLPVDRRDELGMDKADVLYFKKGRYDFKAVRDFRSLLLKDDNIKTAYDSTSQFEFPEHVGAAGQPWIPHLTLGYPDSPAKPMPDEWETNFYSVDFSKIAVWMGDYDGPEFQLKDYWDEMEESGLDMDAPLSVAMAQADPVDEVLAHYGKKGMKWGVRNEERKTRTFFEPEGHDLSTDVIKTGAGVLVPLVAPFTIPAQVRLIRGGARGIKAKAVDVNEQRFTKKAHSDKNFVEIHNRSIERSNREIAKINEKHPGDLTKDPKKQKAYDDEVVKMMQNSYREAAKSIGNKPNTMHLDLEFKNDGLDFKIKAKQGAPTPLSSRVKHADSVDDETIEYTGKIKRDATGHILGLEFDDFKSEKSMAQSDFDTTADLGVVFLAHHGVKGMKWGVRRERGAPGFFETRAAISEAKTRETRTPIEVRVQDSIGTSERKKTKIAAKGGEDHPATEDALRVAAATQKLKKSGVHALSNKELQDVAQRLNLETQVSVLVGKNVKKGPGAKFVERQLQEAQRDPIKTFKTGQKVYKGAPTVIKTGKTLLKTRRLAGIP